MASLDDAKHDHWHGRARKQMFSSHPIGASPWDGKCESARSTNISYVLCLARICCACL